ncbi:DUF5348 domain-containing protein [Neomoorella humiferrea]|uniref:DUF5348 domain-containing protein n=1 Tax=Neomoorella humiferrea TaxID=676965 RepID=UPI0030CD5E8C
MTKLVIPTPENAGSERPTLFLPDGNSWEFHCGEAIEILVGGKWKKFRWEFSDERGWYLLNQEMAFIPLCVKARLPR